MFSIKVEQIYCFWVDSERLFVYTDAISPVKE